MKTETERDRSDRLNPLESYDEHIAKLEREFGYLGIRPTRTFSFTGKPLLEDNLDGGILSP